MRDPLLHPLAEPGKIVLIIRIDFDDIGIDHDMFIRATYIYDYPPTRPVRPEKLLNVFQQLWCQDSGIADVDCLSPVSKVVSLHVAVATSCRNFHRVINIVLPGKQRVQRPIICLELPLAQTRFDSSPLPSSLPLRETRRSGSDIKPASHKSGLIGTILPVQSMRFSSADALLIVAHKSVE